MKVIRELIDLYRKECGLLTEDIDELTNIISDPKTSKEVIDMNTNSRAMRKKERRVLNRVIRNLENLL